MLSQFFVMLFGVIFSDEEYSENKIDWLFRQMKCQIY